jgi:hypothetical protein
VITGDDMRYLILLALTGCALVPHEIDTVSPRSVHVVNEVAGPPGVIAVHVTSSYRTLHIDATHPRYCYRETRQYVLHRPQTAPGLLAPRLIGTAVWVANQLETESSLEDRTLRVTKTDCSVAAPGIVLEVALPSGAIVRAVTDTRGLAHVKVPDGEPTRGVAVVVGGHSRLRIVYSPDN